MSEVSEYDENIKIISIPKDKIENISLEYGFYSERFFAQLFVSIVLILLGFVIGFMPLYRMFLKSDFPEEGIALKPFAFALPMILIGGYYFVSLFRRKYYLSVKADGEIRKLVFQERTPFLEINDFINKANSDFHYNIL